MFAERDALRDFPKGARKKRKKKVAKKKHGQGRYGVIELLSVNNAKGRDGKEKKTRCRKN